VTLIHRPVRLRMFPAALAAVVIASLSLGFFLVDQAAGSTWGPDASACTNSTCDSNYLVSVSCVSSTFCMAVGQYRTRLNTFGTLIEQGTGSAWTLDHSPKPSSGEAELESVSCATKKFCIAVGLDSTHDGNRKIIEEWNGESWKIVDALPTTLAGLQGVSCLSSIRCTAVGYYAIGVDRPTIPLVERWDGRTWSVVPAPNFVVNATASKLNAVTCVDAADCFAVGEFFLTNYREHAGIERWNGTLWKSVPTPSPGTGNLTLASVSCANARLCFADGDYNNDAFGSSGYHSLIEKWNGSTWDLVAAPTASRPDDSLTSVSCVSARFCFAVGFSDPNAGGHWIIDRWGGSSWTDHKPPKSTPSGVLSISGVSCVTSSSCYGAGSYPQAHDSTPALSLIEHWDGSFWSAVSAPNYSG
jgi:hypothetical protein